jgi:Peptidase family M28
MHQPFRKSKFRVQIVNKSSLFRLAILFVTLLTIALLLWLTMLRMPEKSYKGQLPPLLKEEVILQDLLQQDIQKIAVKIGARNYSQYENLNATKSFLETALTQLGYTVRQQEYTIDRKPYYNLEVQRLGTEKTNEVILIGGHYDSAFNSPGANDNGTGAAATLELARIFANKSTKRTIRFVEFTNEEPPFFWTENMGSLVYTKQIDPHKEKVIAMLSLETMGYFSDKEGSQKYPLPIGLLYPNQGNFIGFIGNLNSGDLVRRSISSFRRHTKFPSEGVILPDWIPGVGWSDQWSFWEKGYKGIMITDTAPYRYPYYHTEDDTLDKINFDKLARVVSGLSEVISDLAE